MPSSKEMNEPRTRRAVSTTSSCTSGCGSTPAAMLVMHEMPSTSIPMCARQSPRARWTCRPRPRRSSGRSESRRASRSSARARRHTRRGHGDSPCPRRFIGNASQPAGIHLAHVRKAHAETLVIRSDERIASQHVDVIVDDHQRALSEPGVDAAGGIREDDLLHAEPAHHPRRKDDGRHVMAFVEMRSARQRRDPPARDVANDEPAGMAHHVRHRPVWQLGVGRRDGLLQRVGEIAEPGTQHDRRLRQPAADARTAAAASSTRS